MMLLPPWLLHLLKLLVLRARSRLPYGVTVSSIEAAAWRLVYLHIRHKKRNLYCSCQQKQDRRMDKDGRESNRKKQKEAANANSCRSCCMHQQQQLSANKTLCSRHGASNRSLPVISRNFLAADGHDGTHRGLNLSSRPARQSGPRHLIGRALAPGRLGRAIFSLGAVSHASTESLFSAQPLRNEEVGGLFFFFLPCCPCPLGLRAAL